MHRKRVWFAFWIVVISFSSAYAGESGSGSLQDAPAVLKNHRSVTGTISRITDGAVFLKTGEEIEREFSIKEAHREKIKGLKVGDRITLDLDEGDQIIDISRADDRGIKGYKEKPVLVRGEVVGYEPLKKIVNLKLEDYGALRSYKMKDAAATRMNDIKKGTRVILEIDKENDLVEDFKVY